MNQMLIALIKWWEVNNDVTFIDVYGGYKRVHTSVVTHFIQYVKPENLTADNLWYVETCFSGWRIIYFVFFKLLKISQGSCVFPFFLY